MPLREDDAVPPEVSRLGCGVRARGRRRGACYHQLSVAICLAVKSFGKPNGVREDLTTRRPQLPDAPSSVKAATTSPVTARIDVLTASAPSQCLSRGPRPCFSRP